MKILMVSDNYPSPQHPTRGTFVYNLVQEMCRQGTTVTTVSPEKVWPGSKAGAEPYGPELSDVRRPRYVSFSNKTLYPGLSTGLFSRAAFTGAVMRVVQGIPRPDIVYSHFLYPSGFAALRVARYFDVPAVVALGESSMERHERTFGLRAMHRDLQTFDHIITVSKVLRDYCVERMGVEPDKVTVIPNAVNTELFYPRDKTSARRKLGLPQGPFIVAYLGHFDERKGFARVMAALEKHPDVRAVFIGNGPEHPAGEQVLFAGPVKHDEVPEWLSAADAFVLPTLAEGDPNAVKEALAVGLPVVISHIPPLREQFDERFAIFVNPRSIGEIAGAIELLKTSSERRADMVKMATQFAHTNSLAERARTILLLLDRIIKG